MTETIDINDKSSIEFGFVIIKDNKGNLGIQPLDKEKGVTTVQIYEACHAVCRSIEAQEVAEAVAQQLVQAATTAAGSKAGKLIVPSDLAGKL